MQGKDKTVLVTEIFTWLVLAAIAAALVLAPRGAMWYVELRSMSPEMYRLLLGCFYVCAVPAAAAMVCMLLLLRSIARDRVFSRASVRYIGAISLCCLTAAGVTLICALRYAPLYLVSAALVFMSLITRVVGNVIRAAVALKDENSLTI